MYPLSKARNLIIPKFYKLTVKIMKVSSFKIS
jgi:hypothetical protein